MALEGPYFSDLLLLAFYLSGLRFSPNLTAQERENRSARYMKLVMNMIMEELSKPCSIVTAREFADVLFTALILRAHRQNCSRRMLTRRGTSDSGRESMLCRQPDASLAIHWFGELACCRDYCVSSRAGNKDDPGREFSCAATLHTQSDGSSVSTSPSTTPALMNICPKRSKSCGQGYIGQVYWRTESELTDC